MILRILILGISFTFASCTSTNLTVKKVEVGPESLASRFARSPDPLSAKPPTGEKLYVGWTLPLALNPKDHEIRLKVIYKDLSEETFMYPLTWRAGVFAFSVIGEKFKDTKGVFSYKAELVNHDGLVLNTWKHQMWVNVIH